MSVIAKFRVDEIRITTQTRIIDRTKPSTPENIEDAEMRTIIMSPVYGKGDPNHENTKFWQASPQGKLELGTINPEAWAHFERNKEYNLTFTPAE